MPLNPQQRINRFEKNYSAYRLIIVIIFSSVLMYHDTSKLRRKLSLLSAYKLSSFFQICLFFVEGLTAFLFSSVIIDFACNQFKSKISVPFWSNISITFPPPLATQVNGLSARRTGSPVSSASSFSILFNKAPPPVRTIPRSAISEPNSWIRFRYCWTWYRPHRWRGFVKQYRKAAGWRNWASSSSCR